MSNPLYTLDQLLAFINARGTKQGAALKELDMEILIAASEAMHDALFGQADLYQFLKDNTKRLRGKRKPVHDMAEVNINDAAFDIALHHVFGKFTREKAIEKLAGIYYMSDSTCERYLDQLLPRARAAASLVSSLEQLAVKE